MWCLQVSCASPWGSLDRGARHVSSWGSPDGVAPDSDACHVSLGGKVPTITTSLKILSVKSNGTKLERREKWCSISILVFSPSWDNISTISHNIRTSFYIIRILSHNICFISHNINTSFHNIHFLSHIICKSYRNVYIISHIILTIFVPVALILGHRKDFFLKKNIFF